ncbi:MAG: PD-(D/E)XK nuclease family protein [Acidimicrobiia bacterium]
MAHTFETLQPQQNVKPLFPLHNEHFRPHSGGARLAPPPPRLTPTQIRVFDELLGIGASRPTAPKTLVSDLYAFIKAGTEDALKNWTEQRLWFGKSQLVAALGCETLLVYQQNSQEPYKIGTAAAIGIVSHKAIQLAHTHPGKTMAHYVRAAVDSSIKDTGFETFWVNADDGTQSDLISEATSRVCSYTDSFPPLDDGWTPRFEERSHIKIGKLTLSTRPDLVLGRPRPDGRQTMFITDFKSGALRDNHLIEAGFYALVAALRNGVPPYRSTVYSLASGEWTPPDVTPETLTETANLVVEAVTNWVELLTGTRTPTTQLGESCSWCPLQTNCETYQQQQQQQQHSTPQTINTPTPAPPAVSSTTNSSSQYAKRALNQPETVANTTSVEKPSQTSRDTTPIGSDNPYLLD